MNIVMIEQLSMQLKGGETVLQELLEQMLGVSEDDMEIPEEELSGEEVTDIRTFLQEEG